MAGVTVARPSGGVPSPVEARLEERGAKRVGHIRLSAFNARALSDVAAAVRYTTLQPPNRLET